MSALLLVVAVLIGPLTTLLAIRAALLLLLLATLFFVALLLLIGFLVSHLLSPDATAGARDARATLWTGGMLRARPGLSFRRGDGAINILSLRQPMRL